VADYTFLSGSAVRDIDGRRGRIVGVTSKGELSIGWDDGTLAPYTESFPLSDRDNGFGIEVLTVDQGWMNLGRLASLLRQPGYELIAPSNDPDVFAVEPSSLMSSLAEHEIPAALKGAARRRKSPHNPFGNKNKRIGPGPEGEYIQRKKNWRCQGSDYTYTCVGIGKTTRGRVMKIRVDPERKAAYNAKYKRFVANKD